MKTTRRQNSETHSNPETRRPLPFSRTLADWITNAESDAQKPAPAPSAPAPATRDRRRIHKFD